MPVDVIDLLSSSPLVARPASPQKDAAQSPHRNLGDPGHTPDPGLFVDLTADTPNLLSRSRSRIDHTDQVPSRESFARISSLFFSDDFDTTGDLDGGDDGLVSNTRSTKRVRLSEDQDQDRDRAKDHASGDMSTAEISAQPDPSRRPRSAAELDPIELSSSPRISAKAANVTTGYLDSDLFASSSPAKLYDNLVGIAADYHVTSKSRDGSRQPPMTRSPKQPVAWDPISSSAPQQGHEGGILEVHPRALQRSMSEVITVDDSSSDAHSSSGDEFPDIARISKRRWAVSSRDSPARTKRASTAASGRGKSAEGRAKDKEGRDAERERKKREREAAKRQRALEKEKAAALAEVNKVRVDKKVSAPEMIVHLPSSLADTTALQAQTLLADLDVPYDTSTSIVGDVVHWSRKVRARYNEELEHWEPIPMRIEHEKHAMVILPAAAFVRLVLAEAEPDVDAHVLRMRQHFPDHTLMYLIEGLALWMRKNRANRNRQFISAVRHGLAQDAPVPPSSSQPPPPAASASRRKQGNATRETYIDEDLVEDALLNLQVVHGALIHHTATPLETARQIAVFTQHISTIPYRRQREDANAASAAFCMETGQVRTGDGPEDTYVRMLQEISRVTAPIAHGVAAQFGSVSRLVRGLEAGGPLTLEDVRKSANKDGAPSDRRIGQAVSRRLYKVFTGRDERSTEV